MYGDKRYIRIDGVRTYLRNLPDDKYTFVHKGLGIKLNGVEYAIYDAENEAAPPWKIAQEKRNNFSNDLQPSIDERDWK